MPRRTDPADIAETQVAPGIIEAGDGNALAAVLTAQTASDVDPRVGVATDERQAEVVVTPLVASGLRAKWFEGADGAWFLIAANWYVRTVPVKYPHNDKPVDVPVMGERGLTVRLPMDDATAAAVDGGLLVEAEGE